jgi:hypothetical protein
MTKTMKSLSRKEGEMVCDKVTENSRETTIRNIGSPKTEIFSEKKNDIPLMFMETWELSKVVSSQYDFALNEWKVASKKALKIFAAIRQKIRNNDFGQRDKDYKKMYETVKRVRVSRKQYFSLYTQYLIIHIRLMEEVLPYVKDEIDKIYLDNCLCSLSAMLETYRNNLSEEEYMTFVNSVNPEILGRLQSYFKEKQKSSTIN